LEQIEGLHHALGEIDLADPPLPRHRERGDPHMHLPTFI
jgi:hypothetical protein